MSSSDEGDRYLSSEEPDESIIKTLQESKELLNREPYYVKEFRKKEEEAWEEFVECKRAKRKLFQPVVYEKEVALIKHKKTLIRENAKRIEKNLKEEHPQMSDSKRRYLAESMAYYPGRITCHGQMQPVDYGPSWINRVPTLIDLSDEKNDWNNDYSPSLKYFFTDPPMGDYVAEKESTSTPATVSTATTSTPSVNSASLLSSTRISDKPFGIIKNVWDESVPRISSAVPWLVSGKAKSVFDFSPSAVQAFQNRSSDEEPMQNSDCEDEDALQIDENPCSGDDSEVVSEDDETRPSTRYSHKVFIYSPERIRSDSSRTTQERQELTGRIIPAMIISPIISGKRKRDYDVHRESSSSQSKSQEEVNPDFESSSSPTKFKRPCLNSSSDESNFSKKSAADSSKTSLKMNDMANVTLRKRRRPIDDENISFVKEGKIMKLQGVYPPFEYEGYEEIRTKSNSWKAHSSSSIEVEKESANLSSAENYSSSPRQSHHSSLSSNEDERDQSLNWSLISNYSQNFESLGPLEAWSASDGTSSKVSIPSIVLLVPIAISDSSLNIVQEFCSMFNIKWISHKKNENSHDGYLESRVTHVIFDPETSEDGKIPFEYYEAVGYKKYLVSIKWLLESLEDETRIMVPENYEVPIPPLGVLAPQIARKSRRDLFDGFAILLAKPFIPFSKDQLANLLKFNGAVIVDTPKDCEAHDDLIRICIVGESFYFEEDRNRKILKENLSRYSVAAIKYSWILQCLASYATVSVKPHLFNTELHEAREAGIPHELL